MKKILLLSAFLIIFLTGCSQTQNILGPSIDDANLDSGNEEPISEADADQIALDELAEEMESELLNPDNDGSDDLNDQLDSEILGEDPDDMLNDFDEELAKDNESLDKQNEELEGILKDELTPKDLNDELDKIMDENADNDDALTELKALEPEPEPEPERIGGSCNMISKTSTCIDYVGSFWTETQMKYNCYSGTVSFSSCPGGNIGGCNVLKGSPTETIIWMYPYGGSPISSDTVSSAKPSCDVNPMGNWVSAR